MKTIIAALIFAVNGYLPAQNFKLGFQVESILFYTNSEEKNLLTNFPVSNSGYTHYNPFPSSIYIKIGYNITETISLEFKGGALFADDYTGTEFGLFSKYNVYSILNLIAFYNLHHQGGGGSNLGGSAKNNISLAGCGVGINLNKVISIELLYLIPVTDPTIAGKYSYDHNYSTGLI